jgi:hypothetical protein
VESRFLSRSEWPLIAAGVVAGLITSVLLIWLFMTSLGGERGVDPSLVGEPDTVADTVQRPRSAPEGPGRGLIGRRESGIAMRLAAMPVRARPLRGPLTLVMQDVVWLEEDGSRFARAERMTGQLDMAAAAGGDVILSNVVVRDPVITLRQGRPLGEWNYEQVFAELLAPPEVPPTRVRTIQIRGMQIVNGRVDVTMPDRRFAFENVQGRLPLVVLSQPGVEDPYLRAGVVTLDYVQRAPVAGRLAIEGRDGLFTFPPGTVRFDVADVLLDRTRLAAVRGVWNPGDPGYGVTAEGRAVALQLEDFAFLLPEAFPKSGTASFAFRVRPLPGDRTEAILTELDGRAGESRILGSLTAAVGEEYFSLRAADLRLDPLQLALVEGFTGPLPWGGELRGRVLGAEGDIRFDLAASLTAANLARPFIVDVAGHALMQPDAVLLQRADVTFTRLPLAALRAFAPSLPLDGLVTGRVTLTGSPTAAPLGLDVRLEIGSGVALLGGTLDFTAAVPRYALAGDLIGIDLPGVLAVNAPPVRMTGRFALDGAGFDPATMDARFQVGAALGGWETVAGDSLTVVGSLRAGTLDVERFRVRLATAEATADGTWRFIEPQTGAVNYAVDVASLRPFGPYLPLIGDSIAAGSVRAAGSLSGTLERMRLAGRAAATDVRVGGWQALALEADYDVAFGGDGLPAAIVDATGRNIVTPTAGTFRDGELRLRLASPDLNLALQARRADGGVVDVVATGVIPPDGPRTVVLERARFDLDIGSWSLLQPATVSWLNDEVSIAGLVFEEAASEGRIALTGRVLPLATMDVEFDIAALPIGDIQRMLGLPERVEGDLWAEGVLRGDATAPVVATMFRIERGSLMGVPLRRMDGRLVYEDQLTRVTATAQTEGEGSLHMQTELPSVLQFGGDPLFALLDGVPLSGTLTVTQFSLAPLAAALPAQVQNVTGVINGHVDLTGTAEAPIVGGTVSLAGGSMRVVDLNQTWNQISGVAEFDGRRLIIVDARARSDGWVVASGQVVLERLDNPILEVSINFDGFRPMGVENQRDAAIFGSLAVAGPPGRIELTGRLHIDDGYLVIPQFGGPGVEMVDISRPPPVLGRPLETIDDGGMIEALTIRDLVVSFGEAAWFMADEARAQLSGELTVNKVGTSTPITGTLSGTRGQYTLIAGPLVRRFDVVSAQVRFMGSPTPNPAIDITARRVVFDPAGRQVDVDVRVTGTLETPRVSLAGGDATGIAESELLSFLLFGRPTFALGGEVTLGEDVLQQAFAGVLAEVIAIELERGIGGLGLDVFQIRLGAGPLGGLGTPTVVLGRQLRPDVFLTMETGITALLGGGGAGSAGGDNALHWAVRLDWTFDRRSRARLSWEPVYGGRAFRGAALARPLRDPEQQFLLELRRRWTY